MSTSIKWAGSEEGFHALESIWKVMLNASPEVLKQASDWEVDDEGDDEEKDHYMMEMVNGVGVITVRGALIEGSAGWWGMYYDICGYDDIRNAVICALNCGAQRILVNIMSPGGMVMGIGALTDFLKEVSVKVPITFFTDAYCASGGVWLSVSTGDFKSSRHAEVGSVGVIAVATEYTEYYKMAGIGKQVFKSTPLKGQGNPNEKVSDAVAADIQRGVDESAQRFTDHIAISMGLSTAYVNDNIATGQTWYADEAQRLGLVNGITTFDKLLVDLQQKVSQNTNNAGAVTQPQPTYFQQDAEADMAKRKLIKAGSPEELLAMAASGVPVVTAAEGEVDTDETENPNQEQNDDEEENVVTESSDGEEAAATTPVKNAGESGVDKVIAQMTEQLVSTRVELATVKAEAAVTSTKLAELQAVETSLRQIVATSIQRAVVASGASAPTMDSLMALSSEALVAQMVGAEALLVKRFGTGGQFAVATESEEDEETVKANAAAQVTDEILAPLSRIFSK